jgi:tRNA threonylcarbamoyladenosine biosynthesis protein TsaE
MRRLKTYSSNETKELGEKLGRGIVAGAGALKKKPNKTAKVILLYGELGAGKTTFTKGLYKGLGSKAAVTSPTFIIMRRSRIAAGTFKNIFHLDCYRIEDERALDVLGIKEILSEPSNIVIIEWPEKISKSLPRKNIIKARFAHGKTESERSIEIVQNQP